MQGPRTGFQQDLHNICFIYHGPLSLRHETLARSSQKDPARELIIFFHPGLRESAKISTAPQPERSDTHKSTEKVARGSDIKSRAALRWERSDAHKVPRGLHERYQNSHRAALRAIQGCAEQKRDNRFVRACAVEMHMDISQGHSCASLYSEKTGAPMERPDLTPAFYLHRKNPLGCSPWIPGDSTSQLRGFHGEECWQGPVCRNVTHTLVSWRRIFWEKMWSKNEQGQTPGWLLIIVI
jgi:hypothetical protein